MIKYIIGILVGVGMMYILLDAFKIPYLKTSKSVKMISKKQREKHHRLMCGLAALRVRLQR